MIETPDVDAGVPDGVSFVLIRSPSATSTSTTALHSVLVPEIVQPKLVSAPFLRNVNVRLFPVPGAVSTFTRTPFTVMAFAML